MNYIDDHMEKVDFVRMMIDQNYAFIGKGERDKVTRALTAVEKNGSTRESIKVIDEGKDSLGSKDVKQVVMQPATIKGTKYFNGEELLFLNRVAFYVLSLEGPKIKSRHFIDALTILQDGSFEDKL